MREHAASNATAERVIDVPPPPTYHEVLNEPNSVALEIRSPGIVDAAECMVAEFDPVAAGGKSLSPPEKGLKDHYLPAELSSLTLEDDHGVSNWFYCFFLAHALYATLVSTIPPIRGYLTRPVSIAGRMVGWCDRSPGTRATSLDQEI